ESGYAITDLGLKGAAIEGGGSDATPGQYLGNGCWTAWEMAFDGDGGSGLNGYDPNGTSGLRLWGCPREGAGGGDEALAAWSVAYRGDIQPSLSFQVEVDRVCQREIENTALVSTTTPEISAANNTSSVTLLVDNADVAVTLGAPGTVLDLTSSPS